MNNNLINPLEELEKIPTGVVSQLVKLPGDIVKQAFHGVVKGGKIGTKIDPLTGLEIPTAGRLQQLQKREKAIRQPGINYAREIITGVSQKQKQEIPKNIAGAAGFDKSKVPGLPEYKEPKKELPPPVAAVRKKFSTGERKHGGG